MAHREILPLAALKSDSHLPSLHLLVPLKANCSTYYLTRQASTENERPYLIQLHERWKANDTMQYCSLQC